VPISNTLLKRLEKLHLAAVATHKMLPDAHNPWAVAELVHAVCGTDTTTDHTTPSSLFTGECGDNMPTTWY
jgi:hypothetical protein